MFLLERIINFIAPNHCIICDAEGKILCEWCKPDACLPVLSRCYRCHAQTIDFKTCKSCRATSRLSSVWIVTDYAETAKQLVQDLKYGLKREAAGVIAEYATNTLPFLPPETVIMPVPTAAVRVRERGFDQACLIARAIASSTNSQYLSRMHRIGKTRQVGAKRDARLKQLEHAFRLSSPEKLQGKAVLLVDDVLTTGATLETAARIIRDAGAKSVSAVVFAQAK